MATDPAAPPAVAADRFRRRGQPDASRADGRHLFEVPAWLDRAASWAWRSLLVAAGVVALAFAFGRLRVVIVPVLIALLVAAVLTPLADRLRSRGWPSLLATWTVLAGALATVIGLISVAAWFIASRLSGDSERWQTIGDDIRTWLVDDAPFSLTDEQVDAAWQRAREAALGGLRGLGGDAALVLVEVVSGVFLGLVLVFFFVHDGSSMWRWIVNHLDGRRATAIDEAGRRAVTTLGAYVRGLAITGVVDAVIIGVGLVVLGVPLALPLAILTFFGAFIPIVGATATGVLAVLVAVVSDGPAIGAAVAALVILVQQVEGDVVMPVVMRRQVRLHPTVVLLAVTTGGVLAGVVGAFLAVPVAAVAVEASSTLRARTALDRWEDPHGDDASTATG